VTRVSEFGSLDSGLWIRVSGFGSLDSGLWIRVSGFGSQVSGLMFRVCKLGLRENLERHFMDDFLDFLFRDPPCGFAFGGKISEFRVEGSGLGLEFRCRDFFRP